jgi:hypothetical protein
MLHFLQHVHTPWDFHCVFISLSIHEPPYSPPTPIDLTLRHVFTATRFLVWMSFLIQSRLFDPLINPKVFNPNYR